MMHPWEYEQEWLRALLQAQPTPPPRRDVPVQLDIWTVIAVPEESGGEQA